MAAPTTTPARTSRPRSPRRGPPPDDRGAVLIVALLIAALIALGLTSYLNLNLSSSRLSKRTFDGFAALNLAETGTEEAVWSFNRASAGDPNAWSLWTTNGGPAWQKFTGFTFSGNTTGVVKVYVDNHQPSSIGRPKIVAQSMVGAPNDTPVLKMIEVTLRRRSSFAGGLVAKEAIVFSGANTSVDAWNSDPDGNPLTPPVPYSYAVRTDRGSVATTAFVNNAMAVNDAHIWGYVSTGGAPPQVGLNGSIRGTNTPAGVTIDPQRVSTDFNAEFGYVSAPTNGTFLATVPAVLGTAGAVTSWRATQVSLAGNDTLTIQGDVTLVLTASGGGDALSVAGNASIVIAAGARLRLFALGGVKIAGRGVTNLNDQPGTFQIWGTNTTQAGQSIQIAGNGALKCVVYAPNGDVQINGNGDVMGSVVARSIRVTGNAAFHYDESLAYGEGAEPFTIARWRELGTAAERAPYLALFQNM